MATRGRPRVHADGSRVTTAMRIPKPLVRRLRVEAALRDVSVNLIVVRAIEDWMKKNEGKVKL